MTEEAKFDLTDLWMARPGSRSTRLPTRWDRAAVVTMLGRFAA